MALALVATGCDRSAATGHDPEQPPFTVEDDIVIEHRGPPPEVLFPVRARSGVQAIDEVVDRYVGVALAGNYTQYRIMTSYKLEPVSERAFTRAWHGVERIEVLDIKPFRPRRPLPEQPATGEAASNPGVALTDAMPLDEDDDLIDPVGPGSTDPAAAPTDAWRVRLRVRVREMPRAQFLFASGQTEGVIGFLLAPEGPDGVYRVRAVGGAHNMAASDD